MDLLTQLSQLALDCGTSILSSAFIYGSIGFVLGAMTMRRLLKLGIQRGLLDRPMKLWSAFTNIYRLYLPIAGGIFLGTLGMVLGVNQGVNSFIEDQVDVAIEYITPQYLSIEVFNKYKKTAPASAAITREIKLQHNSNDYMADLLSTYIIDQLGHPHSVADLQDKLDSNTVNFARMAASYSISDYFTSFVDMRFLPLYGFVFFSLGVFLFYLPFLEMIIGLLLSKIFAPRPDLIPA